MSDQAPGHEEKGRVDENTDDASSTDPERRDFLAISSTSIMFGGLAVGYGTFAGMAAYYLYPPGADPTAWLYVAVADEVPVGASLSFQTPGGSKIVVARGADTGNVDDFIALSSVCPHLGCQVHWESHRDRFFCPCHNGVFDAAGVGTSGPPADAGQSLSRYPLKIESGLLFIEVPSREFQVAQADDADGSQRPSSEDPTV